MERGVHIENGARLPEGLDARMRKPSREGPTPRQLAAVYMYATRDQAEMDARRLPIPADEMADALNAVIVAAGSELVWVPPEEGGAAEVEVPEGVPEEAARNAKALIGGVVDRLRAAGFEVEVGGTEVRHVIPHQPDGDPVPEQDGRSVAEEVIQVEKDRYRRLAETVFEGLRRIVDAFGNESEDADRVTMEAVRVMAGALAEGRLIAAVDGWLVERGYASGPEGGERDQAERLARAILDRQIRAREASVRWEDRSGSREKRIAVAETILRADRVGGAVGHAPDSPEWAEAVTGALMAERSLSPSTASRIALTAREVLRSRPDWYTHTVVSEGRTAARAS